MSVVGQRECPLEGNNDLIGIGIRVGVYLFMVSCLFARVLPPKYSGHLQLSALYLIYAEFIVLVRETALRRIQGLEVEAFMWMILPQFAFILHAGRWAANFGTSYLTVVALTAFSFYYVWFWYRGLDILPRTSCADEYGWFFAKISLYHWYRTLQKVVWTALCITYGLVLPAWTFGYSSIKDHIQQVDLGQSFGDLLVLLPVGIAGCEMTIKWNGIAGLNSLRPVGQLVPFILGLGQLVDIIYRIVTMNPEELESGNDSDDDDVAENSLCPHSGVSDVAGGEDIGMETYDRNRE